MASWQINPANGDYIMVNGAPVPDTGLTFRAYYRVKINRTKWLYAPNDAYGSDLYTLLKKTGNASINMCEQALQPMIDDGSTLAVSVTLDATQPSSRNNAALDIDLTDAQGTVQNLNLPPVGD